MALPFLKHSFLLFLLAVLLFPVIAFAAVPCTELFPQALMDKYPTLCPLNGFIGTGHEGEIVLGTKGAAGNPGTWIENIVARAVDYLFFVGAALAPLMVIIGAYLYFTSAGDSKKTENAKKLIIWACVGFAILLFAKAIVSIVRYILEF